MEKPHTSKENDLILVQKSRTRFSKGFDAIKINLLPSVLAPIKHNNWTQFPAWNKIPFVFDSHYSCIVINVRFSFGSVCFKNMIIDLKLDRDLFLLFFLWLADCFDWFLHLKRLHLFQFLQNELFLHLAWFSYRVTFFCAVVAHLLVRFFVEQHFCLYLLVQDCLLCLKFTQSADNFISVFFIDFAKWEKTSFLPSFLILCRNVLLLKNLFGELDECPSSRRTLTFLV